MEYKDYYKVLGVDRNADAAEIKRVYRKLALKYHPDTNPEKGADDRFKEINEAYEVLGNPEKRSKFDNLGASYRAWERTGRQPGGFDWSQWTGGAPGGVRVEVGDLGDMLGGFSDFFNTIFGGAPNQRRGPTRTTRGRGRDIEQSVSITLTEAYTGSSRTFRYNSQTIEVKIPAGAKTGTKVRISGRGEAGPLTNGDLYLVIQVEPDPNYKRKGDNLYVDVDVDLYTAILGGETHVPTPTGEVVLTIPPESQPSQTFRLKGRGMPRLRNPSKQGDLFAKLEIVLPSGLSDHERELFQQLDKLRRNSPRDRLGK